MSLFLEQFMKNAILTYLEMGLYFVWCTQLLLALLLLRLPGFVFCNYLFFQRFLVVTISVGRKRIYFNPA